MSSLTRYSSYERLMLGKQKLIECSSMQAFEKFKLEDKELKESLNSSMYASGVHGLSKCWSDGDENHLQEGENVFLLMYFWGKFMFFGMNKFKFQNRIKFATELNNHIGIVQKLYE